MISAGELSAAIGGKVEGDASIQLKGIAPLETAGPDHLSFLTGSRYQDLVKHTQARVILCGEKDRIEGKTLIVHPDPYFALSQVIPVFYPPPEPQPGIHPDARVDAGSSVHETSSIGAFACVGPDVTVGRSTIIGQGVILMRDITVGDHCVLYPGVTVYPRCKIGNRVILQAGAVIGSDGFGFAFHDNRYHKIPQVGGVILEDDVEIGANATIDAGTLTPTLVGEGTKIDNLVQIAHNVRIGKHTAMAALVGIAGSTRIGDYCLFGGQSGAVGHLVIGDRVQVTGKTGVSENVADGLTISGFPSRTHRQWLKEQALLRRLPKLLGKQKGDSDDL